MITWVDGLFNLPPHKAEINGPLENDQLSYIK